MKYEIFKENLHHEDIGDYESYGIKYSNLISISDVTTDFDSIKNFVDNINTYKTDLRNIHEVIEEYVSC